MSSAPRATLVNALLRCSRDDTRAAAAFELTRADLRLWVLELDVDLSAPWDTQIEALLPQLENHLPFLDTLHDGSRDYTLHLSVQAPSPLPLRLPPRLCAIAATAGFSVELLVDSPAGDAH